MLITVSGPPGSGKTSVARILASRLSIDMISGGSIFREIAREMKVDLLSLNEMAEENVNIDSLVDRKLIEIAKNRKNIVVESHLAGWILKEFSDYSIFLWAPLRERTSRIARRDNLSYERAMEEVMKREQSHFVRFWKYYGIDITDYSVFDLVLNTDKMSAEDVANVVLTVLRYRESKG